MNVFEELIVELKEENLLEQTVIEQDPDEKDWDNEVDEYSSVEDEGFDSSKASRSVSSGDDPSAQPAPDGSGRVHDLESDPSKTSADDSPLADGASIEDTRAAHAANSAPIPQKPKNGREFYKKRAIGEISNLQMVEHVLTGVEREYMKVIPRTFDDFEAKKCLNTFLQVAGDENSPEHAEAEFAMMQETESWCTALSERDKQIPVSALRQFCENSRPALSSQALVALARFYRNLPYSETVRAKFDFVITRLFSKPTNDHRRICLFTKEEMFKHVNLLYKEWSSVPLYSADDDESKILLTALSFEDLAVEAESVSSFDLLISGNFFGRLRLFKESVSELFFAPNVTAAAIDCNIRIGNAYVRLIDQERKVADRETIYSRFEAVDGETVSDATAKTLEIVEILKFHEDQAREEESRQMLESAEADALTETEEVQAAPDSSSFSEPTEKREKWNFSVLNWVKANAFGVNKTFLAISILLVAASVGIYVWANVVVQESVPSPSVVAVDLDKTILKLHVKTGKISGPNFYGVMQPSWDTLSKEEREDYLQKVFAFVQEKGCSQVTLMNTKGQSVAYASAEKSSVEMP